MLDTADILNLNNPHMTGRIITAPAGGATLQRISVPAQDNVLVLSYADMGENTIEIDGMKIPVLAGDTADYDNQPVIAVFGNDDDSTDFLCRQIKIEYSPVPEGVREPVAFKTRSYTWGDCSEPEGEGFRTVRTTYTTKRYSSPLMNLTRILAAVSEDNKIHILVPSQWPGHVRRSVAAILNRPVADIIMHESRFYSKEDQLLFNPSFGACIAAVAAVRTGRLVELVLPMSSCHPAVEITTETVLDADNAPVIQRSLVKADLGAFPYYSEEFVRSIVAGCTPVYRLRGLEIEVHIEKTPLEPAVFFGDLGYSTALSATERQYSEVAGQTGADPSEWKAQFCGAVINEVRRSSVSDKISKVVNDCAEASNFRRLYSIYSQPELKNSFLSSFLGYNRGVGIACGEGIQGFSKHETSLPSYGAEFVLYEGGRLEVVGGAAFKQSMENIISDLILAELNLKRENIVYRSADEEGFADMGPHTLSRSVCFFPETITEGCRLIAEAEKAGQPYPIRQKIRTYAAESRNTFFDSFTCGCLALSLEIDPVLLIPKVTKVWARLAVGRVYDIVRMKHKARRNIITAVNSLFSGSDNAFEIDIEIEEDPALPPGSVSSLLTGLTKAAAAEAIELALKKKIDRLPLSVADMIPEEKEK